MAMSFVIRKAPPTFIPLALRAISSPRTLSIRQSLIGGEERVHVNKETSSFFPRQFSTVTEDDVNNQLVDHKFIEVLNSESEYFNRIIPTKPIDFPFKEDDQDWHIFTRELPGEKIKVRFWMHYDWTSINEGHENLHINVEISKKDGSYIELQLIATPADHDVIVKKLIIELPTKTGTKKSLNVTSQLEKVSTDVQYCLKKFVEMRGINRTNIEFWRKHFSKCQERDEVTMWLNGFKAFVME